MVNQPNVVIFFTDQQRWDASGLHGNPLGIMPNFDRLAHQGTHLFNSFTCAPVCGPARACLQTGTYISTNGAISNGHGLPDNLPTMAECFKGAGYHTGYVGKWHLAGPDGKAVTELGERGPVKEGHRGGYQHWMAAEALEFSVHEYKTVLYDNNNQPHRLPGYRSDAMLDEGIRYINDHKNEPFFLMMSFIEPHHQNDKDDYPPPDGYREQYAGRWTPPDLAALPHYGRDHADDDLVAHQLNGGTSQGHLGGYWGMIKRLDEGLGRLTDALKSLDILDNTIILFTSDHACHFKTRNWEYKRSCHDSSIRVPTMLTGGPFTGGRTIHEMVSLVDMPATLLDACGIDVPDEMEGKSILPLLQGDNADWPEEAFVQICDDEVGRAVRTGRWKYCVMAGKKSNEIGTDFANQTYTETYLYDLQSDPYELRNLIDLKGFTPVRDRMRQRLINRMKEIEGFEPNIQQVETRPSGQFGLHPGEAEM